MHELLHDRIPDDRPAELHGDIAKVADRAGRMSNLNGNVRIDPGLDRLDERPVVAHLCLVRDGIVSGEPYLNFSDALAERTIAAPVWVHFGIGNIFRIFVGSIADRLAEEGRMDRGITCVETFDYDVVDRIYRPYDNLSLSVYLHGDGTVEKKVVGVFSEAVKAQASDEAQWNRLKEIFTAQSLQMVTFTITEKKKRR